MLGLRVFFSFIKQGCLSGPIHMTCVDFLMGIGGRIMRVHFWARKCCTLFTRFVRLHVLIRISSLWAGQEEKNEWLDNNM